MICGTQNRYLTPNGPFTQIQSRRVLLEQTVVHLTACLISWFVNHNVCSTPLHTYQPIAEVVHFLMFTLHILSEYWTQLSAFVSALDWIVITVHAIKSSTGVLRLRLWAYYGYGCNMSTTTGMLQAYYGRAAGANQPLVTIAAIVEDKSANWRRNGLSVVSLARPFLAQWL